MKTGKFDGEHAEYRRGNFGFAHEWLQEFKTLDEVPARLRSTVEALLAEVEADA